MALSWKKWLGKMASRHIMLVKARGNSGSGNMGSLWDFSEEQPSSSSSSSSFSRPISSSNLSSVLKRPPSLFDVPSEPKESPPAAEPGVTPGTPGSSLSLPDSISARSEPAAQNVEFEQKHPRGGAGGPTFNPETGKEIKPGQFAPKMQEDEVGSAEESDGDVDFDEWSPDMFANMAKEHSSKILSKYEPADAVPGGGVSDDRVGGTEQSDALGPGISGEHEEKPPSDVPGLSAQSGPVSDSIPGPGEREGDVSGPGEAGVESVGGEMGGGKSDDMPADGEGRPGSELEQQLDGESEEINPDDIVEDVSRDSIALTDGDIESLATGTITQSHSIPGLYDYFITEETDLGGGGFVEKYKRNVAAIKLLKVLNEERRMATPDEQLVLARYTGWGWASRIFHVDNVYAYGGAGNECKHMYDELKELLSPQEIDALRDSTLNAHYTSKPVVEAMWNAIQSMGFEGGRILEPAVGSGNFLGLMPREIWVASQVTGLDIDPTTAEIAYHLYQSATIHAIGFEKSRLDNDYYDLVISNVPFGDYRVFDKEYEDKGDTTLTRPIHNYFFAKALDKVRPGGIVAFITSHYTMDSHSEKFRHYINSRADLLGAIRLPSGTFKRNAGTDVLTDIIFLRKRAVGERPAKLNDIWIKSSMTEMPHLVEDRMSGGVINQYFNFHPEHVLGTHAIDRGLYSSSEIVVKNDALDDRSIYQAITSAASTFCKPGIYSPAQSESFSRPDVQNPQINNINAKDGSYIKQPDGRIARYKDNKLVYLFGDEAKQVEMCMSLVEHAKDIMSTMIREDATDQEIADKQLHWRNLYNKYTSLYGAINGPKTKKAFGSDFDYGFLISLENIDESTGSVGLSDVFHERILHPFKVPERADSVEEALAIARSYHASFDVNRVAKLLGMSRHECVDILLTAGHIFMNESGEYVPSDEYLSGDVAAKLESARERAKKDPRFENNVRALEAVQPERVNIADVGLRLSMSWLPADVLEQFIRHIAGMEVDCIRNPLTNQFEIGEVIRDRKTWADRTIFGNFRPSMIIKAALEGKILTVYYTDEDGVRRISKSQTVNARHAVQVLNDKFAEWCQRDENIRANLENIYNRTFNGYRPREYDGSHLIFDGMSKKWADLLMPHQRNAVWRQLCERSTLLAHAVGAGKTASMAIAAMHGKRMGLWKKPMFVVPNHLVAQWAREFREIYPGAKIITTTEDAFDTTGKSAEGRIAMRRTMVSRIALGDWDAVIVPFSHFNRMQMSAGVRMKYIADRIDELQRYYNELDLSRIGSRERSRLLRQIIKRIKRLEVEYQKAENALSSRRDNTLDFDNFGVDRLFVDEAHAYKNLPYVTNLHRVGGFTTEGSQRSVDMQMKCEHMQKLGGVTFATGTPIANSLSEIWTMMRYLIPDYLKKNGLDHFDAWRAQFADVVQKAEIAADGSGFKPRLVLSKYINVPELSSTVARFADVKTINDLNLRVPKVVIKPVEVQGSDHFVEYLKQLGKRAEAISAGGVNPADDNMFKVLLDGRKASLDMRMVGIDDGGPRLAKCAENVWHEYQNSHDIRGTQMVFCDLGTPKQGKKTADSDMRPTVSSNNDGYELAFDENEQERIWRDTVYGDLKKRLIEQGIPEHEIAFIHDARNDKEKHTLMQKVRDGHIRVLIGSTEKMGTGMNAQLRAVALHHLDCPWRPCDVIQRNARIVRQGNMNDSVTIYPYITVGNASAMSLDAFMWQSVERKEKLDINVLSGKIRDRVVDDVMLELSPAEMKALATGDPRVMEKVNLDMRMEILRIQRANWLKTKQENAFVIAAFPQKMEDAQAKIEQIKNLIVHNDKKHPKSIVLNGVEYSDAKEANEALTTYITNVSNTQKDMHVGTIDGFDIYLEPISTNAGSKDVHVRWYVASHGAPRSEAVFAGDMSPGANTNNIQGVIRRFIGSLNSHLEMRREMLDGLQRDYNNAVKFSEEFPYAREYADIESRLAELNNILGANDHINHDDVFEDMDTSDDDDDEYDTMYKSLMLYSERRSRYIAKNQSLLLWKGIRYSTYFDKNNKEYTDENPEFHFKNFYRHPTKILFKPTLRPSRSPDFVSKSGSKYWDEGDRLIRHSDHWGMIGDAMWRLDGHALNHYGEATGEAAYADIKLMPKEILLRRLFNVQPGEHVRVRRRFYDRSRFGKYVHLQDETLEGPITGKSREFIHIKGKKVKQSTIYHISRIPNPNANTPSSEPPNAAPKPGEDQSETIKSIYLNRETGYWYGRSSGGMGLGRSRPTKMPKIDVANIPESGRGVVRHALRTGGFEHVGTNEKWIQPIASGAHSPGEEPVYHHEFRHVDPSGEGVSVLRAKLSKKYTIGPVRQVKGGENNSETGYRFVAVSPTRVKHYITIWGGAQKKERTIPMRSSGGGHSSMSGSRPHEHGIVNLAANYELVHSHSQPIGGRAKPHEQEYIHHFVHETPHKQLRQMHADLAETHHVSPIRQRRVFHGGVIRHRYEFHARPRAGGPGFVVTAVRPS